jgi:hypothetical protein
MIITLSSVLRWPQTCKRLLGFVRFRAGLWRELCGSWGVCSPAHHHVPRFCAKQDPPAHQALGYPGAASAWGWYLACREFSEVRRG